MDINDIYKLLDDIKYDSCFCALSEDIKSRVRDFAEEYESVQNENQGDEEIIKLDLKKARESGFEYIITYNSTPITVLPDGLKHYKNENYMAIIKKRHIKTDLAKQPWE